MLGSLVGLIVVATRQNLCMCATLSVTTHPSVVVDFNSIVYLRTPFGPCPPVVHCRPLQVGLKASECVLRVCGPNIRMCVYFLSLSLLFFGGKICFSAQDLEVKCMKLSPGCWAVASD